MITMYNVDETDWAITTARYYCIHSICINQYPVLYTCMYVIFILLSVVDVMAVILFICRLNDIERKGTLCLQGSFTFRKRCEYVVHLTVDFPQ